MVRRICLVGAADNVHLQRWALALQAQGLHVSIISTTPGTMLPRALASVPLYPIPVSREGLSPGARLLTLLQGWARVPALVSALKPDLVHVHALPTPAAVPLLRLVNPLVVSVWGSDVVQRDRRKARLYPRLLTHASEVTATSRYLASATAAYLGTPRSIRVIPFGVDAAQFAPSDTPPSIHLGTVRHLEPNYGLDLLIAALPALVSEVPGLRVAIAGSGRLEAALRNQAHLLGVAEHIHWYGRIPHSGVPTFLGSLELFVNPSRAESFGVAAIEAQACGVPVIASRVGGLPEVVRDGETGVLVPPEDPDAIAAAILALLRDPQRRSAMGRVARAWVRERYDWRANVLEMLDVYRLAVT